MVVNSSGNYGGQESETPVHFGVGSVCDGTRRPKSKRRNDQRHRSGKDG